MCMILNHGAIQVANSKVFCKLGNGTVRDLTLDTNTVYTHPTTKQCDYSVSVVDNLTSSSTTAALSANQGRLLNSSVSNGKTQVANAITGKGVAASGSDSFATLANKISQISAMSSIVYTTLYDLYLTSGYTINATSTFGYNVEVIGVLAYKPTIIAAYIRGYTGQTNAVFSAVTVSVSGSIITFDMQSGVSDVNLFIYAARV